jgi:hypothetical protein
MAGVVVRVMETTMDLGPTHIDGAPIYSNEDSAAAEDALARRCERAWTCELVRFGRLAPVDFYAMKSGRIAGLVEMKIRKHAITDYPSVFLSLRKWLALSLAEFSLDVPALFVVQFRDGARWVNVRNAHGPLYRTRSRGREWRSDSEPVILVPISAMRPLAEDGNGNR